MDNYFHVINAEHVLDDACAYIKPGDINPTCTDDEYTKAFNESNESRRELRKIFAPYRNAVIAVKFEK